MNAGSGNGASSEFARELMRQGVLDAAGASMGARGAIPFILSGVAFIRGPLRIRTAGSFVLR
jgi:hypothetical protein